MPENDHEHTGAPGQGSAGAGVGPHDHAILEDLPKRRRPILRMLVVAVIVAAAIALIWWLAARYSKKGTGDVPDTPLTQEGIRDTFNGSLIPDQASPQDGQPASSSPASSTPAETPDGGGVAALPDQPPGATPYTPPPPPPLQYSNQENGYSIDLPSGWQVNPARSSGSRTMFESPSQWGYVEVYPAAPLEDVARALGGSPDVTDVSWTVLSGVPAISFTAAHSGGSGLAVVGNGRLYYLRGALAKREFADQFLFY